MEIAPPFLIISVALGIGSAFQLGIGGAFQLGIEGAPSCGRTGETFVR
jgi:hypothetical protein